MKSGMGIMVCLALSLMCLLGVSAFGANDEVNDIEPGVLFLQIVNSARANGMGGCAVNLVNEQSALYNPGALGLFHLNKVFSASFPSKTAWLPPLDLDVSVKTFGYSCGVSSKLLLAPDADYNIAVGFAYSQLKIDLGTFTYTDEMGNYLGTYNPMEKSDLFTIAFAADYRIRIGLGVTFKKIKSDLSGPGIGMERGIIIGKSDARDYGLLLEIPVFSFLNQASFFDQSGDHPINLDLTPSFAYVVTNIGDDITYSEAAQGDPLPETRKRGISLTGAVNAGPATVGSARLTWEEERSGVGDPDHLYKRGWELGIMGSLYLRFGRYKDYNEGVVYSTRGFGIDTKGLVSWIMVFQPSVENSTLKYLTEHASLTFDYARFSEHNSPLDDTKFVKLNLSF
jgi:hypothetical protein